MEENKNPWLGLNTYTEQDRLYGRDKESREVADIILNNLSTVIYGRSGIGKSSLLRAGVFPLMRYEDFLPVYVRLEHNATTKYIDQIHHKIKVAAKNANLSISPKEDEKIDSLRELLCHYAFNDKLTHIPKHLMLVFDQFEEIFTLAGASYNNDVQGFFSELASVLNDTATANGDCGLFRIVICLREDCLYFLEQISSDIPSLKRNRYRLTALSHEQGLDVICKPRPDLVNKETAEAILAKIDVKNKGEIDPAILSLFMHELYEKGGGIITQENIGKLGNDIINNFYKEGMDSVSGKSAAYLEGRLVTTDGYRHSLSKADAINDGCVSEEELNSLKQKRIIITIEKGEGNQELIELSHDILCPIVLKSRNERKQKEEKERLRKRNKIVTAFLIVAVLIVGSFWMMNEKVRQQQNNMLITQSIYVCSEAEKLNNDYLKGIALVTEVFPHNLNNPNRPVTDEAYGILRDFLGGFEMEKILYDYKSDIKSAQFNSDGSEIITVSGDGNVIIWNVVTGKRLRNFKMEDGRSVQISSTGRFIIIRPDSRTIDIWDVKEGKKISEIRLPVGEWCDFARISKDGKKALTVYDSTIDDKDICKIWDVTKRTNILTLHNQDISSAQFSPDGKTVLLVSDDKNRVTIMDLKTGKDLLKLDLGDVDFSQFSSDGKKIVIADYNKIFVLDAKTGKEMWRFNNSSSVEFAQLSPDGKKMAVLSYYGVFILDVKTKKPLMHFRGERFLESAQFSPDGKRLVTTDGNNAILWNVEETRQPILDGHKPGRYSTINDLHFSPNGKMFVTASNDSTAIIWNSITGERLFTLRGHMNDVCAAQFSPDSKILLTASKDGTARIWNVQTGEAVRVIDIGKHVKSACFSPNGKNIIIVEDGCFYVYDVMKGTRLSTFGALGTFRPNIGLNQFCFNENKVVVTYNSYLFHTAVVWDMKTGKEILNLGGHLENVRSAQFSSDGEKIVTTSNDSTVIIWNAKTGTKLCVLKEDAAADYAQFTPDNKRIVVYCSNDKISVWDVIKQERLCSSESSGNWGQLSSDGEKALLVSGECVYLMDVITGKCLCCLDGHDNVDFAVFSPDGKKIVTAYNDGTVRMWYFPTPQDLIDKAISVLNGYKLSKSDRKRYYLE